jgi:hypothetical protein
MAITYSLKGEIIVFTTEGDVDFSEGLKTVVNGLQEYHQTVKNGEKILFDIVHSQEQRSSDDIRMMGKMISQYVHAGRIAILVGSPMYYAMSRMFGAYVINSKIEIQIFTDRFVAEQWLNSYLQE